jgi:predicted nucleic acid-binding protein
LERAFISVVTVEEIELGILLKERRHGGAPRLRRWFAESVLDGFSGRILPITADVARRAAALHVGQTRPANDARIAATALTHGLTLVTRNAAHFAGTGVTLVNPWAAPA